MVYKRTYKKRPIRRRRYIKRRYTKPSAGMGALGKRFIKFREVRDLKATSGQSVTVQIYNNPSEVAEYTHMAQLFSRVKICAMKIKWIPVVNTNSWLAYTSSTNVQAMYNAMYVWHDQDNLATSIDDPNIALENENCKVKNAMRPWKFYAKMTRSTVGTDTDLKGYQVSDPAKVTSSQMIRILCPYGTSVKEGNVLGKYVITWYCTFKARE